MKNTYTKKQNMNRLLELQFKKHFGHTDHVPAIFKEISGFYDHFEFRRKKSEYSIKTSAEQLMELNRRLELKKEKLQLSESRFKEAQAIAHIGSWERDAETGLIVWSEEACRIFGLEAEGNVRTFESWISFIHPEDLDFVYRAVKDSAVSSSAGAFDYRIIRKDGEVRYLSTKTEFGFDKEGNKIRLHGTVHDVTEQKQIEQQKAFDSNNLFSLLNTTKDLMWSIGTDLKMISSNDAFDNMITLITGQIPSKGKEVPVSAFSEEKLTDWTNYYNRAFSGEIFTIIESMQVPVEVWSEISFYPIRKENEIVGTACYSRNITDIKKAEQEILKLNEGLEDRVKQRTAELERTNALLESETARVVNASKIIEQKNKDITDSLNYAKLIQNAIVHKKDALKNLFPDSFKFSMPLDIVSGDFVKVADKKNVKLIALADCTGHGIPGALMSMIGSALLSDVMNKPKNTKPSQMLKSMDAAFKAMMNDTAKINDGMDVSLCSIDLKKMELNYAGAHRPLYLVRAGQLIEIKGDYFSIGGAEFLDKKFTTTTLTLEKDDSVYLFSDGYTDQFGGAFGKKFSTRRLKDLIVSIQHLRMEDQEQILKATIEEWKKDLAQVDDICVLGFRI